MNSPILRDDSVNIELKPYTNEHVEETVQWLCTPFLQETFGTIPDLTISTHLIWLKENEKTIKWAIYHQNEYIGNLFIFPNCKHYSGYLQIYIGNRNKIGQNIGSNALRLALDYFFIDLKWNRIWLHCLPNNIPALKLYQKMGFSLEGLERDSLYRNGIFVSQGVWSLLKGDWQKRRKNL